MGLVALSPADMLTSVVAAAQAPAGGSAPATPAATSDGFAALVTALVGQSSAPAPQAELPPPLPKAKNDGKASDELAAVLASALAALQVAAGVAPAPEPPAKPAAEPSAPPSALVGAGALTVLAQPGTDADSVVADPSDDPASNAAVPAPVIPAAAANSQSLPADIAKIPTETAAIESLTPLPPAGSAPRATNGRGDDLKPDADSPGPSSSPPPGAAPTITDLISVVRSVGNAEQGNESSGHNGGPHHGAPAPTAAADTAAYATSAAPLSPQLTPAAATATQATPAAAPAHVPPPVEQVARAVIEQVQQGGGEAKIHLHPAELGELVIRVHTDGDHVRVEVHADHAEAMNLLRDHTADLSNLLGGRGLNLSDVYVGLGGQSGGSNGQDQSGSLDANSPANSEFAAILGLDEPASAIDTHLRLRAAYNPDGALSYRV